MQKMDWEWKVNEITGGTGDGVPTQMDDLHIPMINVSDDFDLANGWWAPKIIIIQFWILNIAVNIILWHVVFHMDDDYYNIIKLLFSQKKNVTR